MILEKSILFSNEFALIVQSIFDNLLISLVVPNKMNVPQVHMRIDCIDR